MIAIDTNVLVRLIVADDPEQTRRARALASDGPMFVPVTVILETEWVLRALYEIPADDITRALRLTLDTTTVEDRPVVERALDRLARGLDLADALHLVRSSAADAFATFDTKLVRRAKKLAVRPPVRSP
jgi:predicted nucleic-acid-binding protein